MLTIAFPPQLIMPVQTALIPLVKSEFHIGQPSHYSIYDRHGKLLMASGVLIESQLQLDNLLDHGYILRGSTTPAPSIAALATASLQPEKEISCAMEQIRWTVGETLFMQDISKSTPRHDFQPRHAVKLIGFIKGKSVLVSMPVNDGQLLHEHQQFVLRAFQGNKAFAFTAAILKVTTSPFPYLHLSWPEKVISSLVRHDTRTAVNLLAVISLSNPERSSGMHLLDLSLGGAYGVVRENIAKIKETGVIRFKVNAVGEDEFLELPFVLRSINTNDGDLGYRYGIEFVKVPMQCKLILSAYVHKTIAEAL